MLARYLFSSTRATPGGSRPAESVLRAAAEQIGAAPDAVATIAHSFESNGVYHDWQLVQLTDSNWEKLDIAIGLQAAIRAELVRPSAICDAKPLDAPPPPKAVAAMPERLQRFLLLPGSDGKDPQPLKSISAVFLAILMVAPEDRQHLVLVLCEMLILITGLILPLPLEFRPPRAAASTWEGSPSQGWDMPPSRDDAMDAVVFIIFAALLFTAFFSVIVALMVAGSGWRGGDRYYEAIMPSFGALFVLAVFAGCFPLAFLMTWHLFTVASSPYPLLGATAVFFTVNAANNFMLLKCMITVMPLEIYHVPDWMFWLMRNALAPMLRSQVSRAALKPAAELRAAELRARRSSFS